MGIGVFTQPDIATNEVPTTRAPLSSSTNPHDTHDASSTSPQDMKQIHLHPTTNRLSSSSDHHTSSPHDNHFPPATFPNPSAVSSSSSHKKDPLKATFSALSILDRFLWLWILLAMAVGVVLGYFVPSVSRVLTSTSLIDVSLPIAIGLLVMMFPILCKIQFETLHKSLRRRSVWKHLGFSFLANWILAPLVMVALAWATLPDRRDLRQGLILVGIARCIAMVLIWTHLSGGDESFCAILVGFNSLLQIILYAPLGILYIEKFDSPGHHGDKQIGYATVAKSVAVFLGIPLGAAILFRFISLKTIGPKRYAKVLSFIGPLSLLGLLFTVIVLFAAQGKHVIDEIVDVVRVSVPLMLYFSITFLLSLAACRRMGFTYTRTVAQSFTATSNNFELAIAVAVAGYGIDSRQALAATVGPLIEIPVMVGLVYVFKLLHGRWQWPSEQEDGDVKGDDEGDVGGSAEKRGGRSQELDHESQSESRGEVGNHV